MKPASCFPRRASVSRAVLAPLFLFLSLVATALNAAEKSVSSPLLDAVRAGDEAKWTAALDAKPDVNARDATGNTALHFAALNHDLAAVTALIAAGAEVDAKNAAEATPLLYGAGQAGIVRALLARGANPNAASKLRVTPLMAAVAYPDPLESATLLVEAGADVTASRSADTGSVLTRAVFGGNHPTIRLLLSRGAAKDAKSAANSLRFAAFGGDTALVELLLAHGADPNLTDNLAGHALNIALLGEETAAAGLLIEKGANIGLRSIGGHGTPPMVFAGYNQTGDVSAAKALIERGVDVNATNDHGATALSYALRSGPHTPLVEYLRSVGAKSPEPTRVKRTPDRTVPSSPTARAELVRERMPATIKLLQRSSDAFLDNGFVQKSGCTSCHGQDLPAVAYDLARRRGFAIDDASLGRHVSSLVSRLQQRSEYARQIGANPLPGSPVGISYALFGLRAARYPADENTGAFGRYLIHTQRSDGAWTDPIRRPPMEDGTLVATGWVALTVRDYAPPALKQAAADSLARSARWLAQQKPATHNDAVFQLLGLHWSTVPRPKLAEFVQRLAAAQRTDGGWAQLAGLESDAWATGSALYALHEAGGMATTDPVYQRGVAFLLRTQFDDGSWWVRSRSWPFQPHFNSQFPHGKDQWISQGGTAWAAMALLFTLEPNTSSAPPPTAHDLIAKFKQSPAAQKRTVDATTPANPAAAAVDFSRDVRPIFERSCAGCHGGEKPRGEFALVSRESLLKGGASGEPAVAPGYSDDSTLIQYVTGKFEDLEMPPLNKREKYPALSAAEVDTLRAWIDAGAPWPTTESLKPKSTATLEE